MSSGFGITDFAQDALGDIVFVNLPGSRNADHRRRTVRRGGIDQVRQRRLRAGHGNGHCTQRLSDDEPGALNTDPYGGGWLVEVQVEGVTVDYLSAEDYDATSPHQTGRPTLTLRFGLTRPSALACCSEPRHRGSG